MSGVDGAEVIDVDHEHGKGSVEAPGALELDPFAFYPEAASAIAGLGRSGPSPTPKYAFHTPYVEAAAGPANFTVRLEGLRAKSGTLLLRVHMLPTEPGGRARMANSERVALNRLVHMGGEITIRFEGFHDMTFALVGLIQGETDAAADNLIITLDRPADPTAWKAAASAAASHEMSEKRTTAAMAAAMVIAAGSGCDCCSPADFAVRSFSHPSAGGGAWCSRGIALREAATVDM